MFKVKRRWWWWLHGWRMRPLAKVYPLVKTKIKYSTTYIKYSIIAKYEWKKYYFNFNFKSYSSFIDALAVAAEELVWTVHRVRDPLVVFPFRLTWRQLTWESDIWVAEHADLVLPTEKKLCYNHSDHLYFKLEFSKLARYFQKSKVSSFYQNDRLVVVLKCADRWSDMIEKANFYQ